ncbi:MAG: hypothetical protein AB8H86_29225 [Polyangiales bacterium]
MFDASKFRRLSPWMEHQARIATLQKRAKDEPKNLKFAQELWTALGSGEHDLRSGVHLVPIFRAVILDNPKSAILFARAYEDLARRSGETPRSELFDAPLVQALRDVRSATQDASLDWLCSFLRSTDERE